MKTKFAYALVTTFVLGGLISCGESKSSEHVTSNETTTSTPTIDPSKDSTTSSEDAPVGKKWNEDTLKDMKKAFSSCPEMVLPFPKSFSEKYVNASMKDDTDGVFTFTVYEEGDTVNDYYDQLVEWNVFTNNGYIDGLDEYYFEYNVGDEKLTTLYIELFYDTDFLCTTIQAYELPNTGYIASTSFPYELISSRLNTKIDETKVPSFAVKEGFSYDVTPVSNKEVVYIGGYVSDKEIETHYLDACVALEYDIRLNSDSTNTAFSEKLGLNINFYNYVTKNDPEKGDYFFIEVSKYVAPVEGSVTISLEPSHFAGYSEKETVITDPISNLQLGYTFFMNASGKIQSPKDDGRRATLYNKTQISHFNKLVCEIDAKSVNYYLPLHLFVGNDASNLTEEVIPTIKDTTVTYEVNKDCKYFKLTNEGNSKYASKLTSMKLDLVI